MENQEPEVSVHRIYTESIDSQSFHRRLELSRAREQKLDAYLLASEQERERLKALVSTLDASRRNQQGWKEIAAVAKSLYVESETTASNLREDLAAATGRVRRIQEQLDHQTELASDKDGVIQSITKESRLAQTRFRIERDRRLRETKEFLREKAMARDQIRRLTHDTQEAQEQLDALRNTLSQHRDHPPRYQPPTTWLYDTGRPPLPPECNVDTGTPPISSAIDPDSSHCYTKSSSRSPIHDSSTHLAARLLETPGFCDQESEVAKEQRAALAELIERMRQVEPVSAEDVKPNERDETRLQEELIATKEQLRLAEEDVRDLRRELGQSRESLREAETHVRSLEYELGICQATVREAQDAQCASEVKFTEATQLLRVHQAESESSAARAEESQFKCSQATLLCTTLQERVTELEAKVKKLKARGYRRALSDREAVVHDPGIQESDSIYMTVPPSMPCLLDLPLPPSSSPSNDSSLYLSHHEYSTIPFASTNSGSGSCCPTNTGMLAPISCQSRPHAHIFQLHQILKQINTIPTHKLSTRLS
jgi:chromosome segregation ATPase